VIVIIKYENVIEEIKYLKLRKYCVALPGVISENTFIKSVSCWGVSWGATILSFVLVLVERRDEMCL
jgi:hypothetical protein